MSATTNSLETSTFDMSIQWRKTDDASPEISATSGELEICLNGRYATRHYDSFSQTMIDHALISAYPLALWPSGRPIIGGG